MRRSMTTDARRIGRRRNLLAACRRRRWPRTRSCAFVQNGNLTILDPIWTTAYVTRNHGYFIYDTLFAIGREQRGQAADGRQVRGLGRQDAVDLHPARRAGWHDGTPVTAEDCIASIKRWGARDAMGQKLMDFVKEFKAVDAKTFHHAAQGAVRPGARVARQAVVERAVHDAEEDRRDRSLQADRQPDRLGPVHLLNAESKPGEKHVYVKNTKYKPRSEPPSGLAGGKVVKVDRVEIIEMPDPQQQVNAIIAGEIDLIEQPPHDLIPILKNDKNVQLVDWNPLGQQFVYPHQPPAAAVQQSEDPPGRAALRSSQEDYLKATVGEPQYYKVSSAAFICGTPNAFDAPDGLFVKPNFEKAKALLKEAGYDGTPIVLMQSTTLPVLTNTAPVTKSLLEKGGFKVDMQSMDWQTLVTRRTKKDPPNKGGWNVFHTFTVAADILNPISNTYMVAQGDKSWFGWPTDPEMEKLRDAYAKETDPAKAKAAGRGGAGPRASRPRSTAGSASGTDRVPRARTSAAGSRRRCR